VCVQNTRSEGANRLIGTHRPNLRDSVPVDVYGVVLLGAAIAYAILTRALLAVHGPESPLAQAVGRDRKGKLSIVAYVVAIAVAPVLPWFSVAVYIAVAAAWLIPDRRVERVIPPTATRE
jgi:uncharacterized membrane protein